jgi:hypothetical protein
MDMNECCEKCSQRGDCSHTIKYHPELTCTCHQKETAGRCEHGESPIACGYCVFENEMSAPRTESSWGLKGFSETELHHLAEVIADDTADRQNRIRRIKDALKILLQKQHEEFRRNIGMMRQWLNEDRITDPKKMVSNAVLEDLLHWLEKPSV